MSKKFVRSGRRVAEVDAPVYTSIPSWTFLTNHAHVLITLAQHDGIVLREIAQRVGITERAVQKIIAELAAEGFLKRVKVGRQNHYKLHLQRPLRHPIEQHRTIGDIIKLVVQSD